MTKATLKLSDDKSLEEKKQLAQKVADFLNQFPSWDISVEGVKIMGEARLKSFTPNLIEDDDEIQEEKLRMEFVNVYRGLLAGVSINVPWATGFQWVDLTAEAGEDAKVTFLIGIDQEIVFSTPTF